MKKGKPDVQQREGSYEEFLRSLKLIALGLTTSSTKFDRYAYAQILDEKNEVRSISAEYELERAQDDFFDAVAKFRITVSNKKTGLAALSIECTMDAHFHGKKKLEAGLAKRFIASELRLVVWPYFRQFVTDITSRMAIRPIVIPLSTEANK